MTYYREFFDSHNQLKQTRNIECARWGNLVYARTLKAGSEFFYKNFTQTAGWEPCRWADINWGRDHVFSYVMDPIKRRHKGISEFLIQTNSVDLLFNSVPFQQVIAQVPALDDHSASLHNIYGEYINRIEWLPMDSNHATAVNATDRLLEQHGHFPIKWNSEFAHTTANYMDDIYNRVKQLWDQQFINDYVRFYFAADIELYRRTLAK
jgi:hypothetical protein